MRLERILWIPNSPKRLCGRARASFQFTWRKSAEVAVAALFQTIEKHRSAIKRNVVPLSELRQFAIRSLGARDLSDEIIANSLARAETAPKLSRRLLIDATSTIYADHGTGIQRLPKKSRARCCACRSRPSPLSYIATRQKGFSTSRFKGDSYRAIVDRNSKSKNVYCENDIVLMLIAHGHFILFIFLYCLRAGCVGRSDSSFV